jgi:hypothetical protein
VIFVAYWLAELGKLFPEMARTTSGPGEVRHALGDRLVDRYLELVAGRARPNTLRAVAFDLKAFFSVVSNNPVEVTAADVFDSWLTSGATAAWCGWLTGSQGCQRGRSPGGRRRCRALRASGGPRGHAGAGQPGAAGLATRRQDGKTTRQATGDGADTLAASSPPRPPRSPSPPRLA